MVAGRQRGVEALKFMLDESYGKETFVKGFAVVGNCEGEPVQESVGDAHPSSIRSM